MKRMSILPLISRQPKHRTTIIPHGIELSVFDPSSVSKSSIRNQTQNTFFKCLSVETSAMKRCMRRDWIWEEGRFLSGKWNSSKTPATSSCFHLSLMKDRKWEEKLMILISITLTIMSIVRMNCTITSAMSSTMESLTQMMNNAWMMIIGKTPTRHSTSNMDRGLT